MNKNNYCIIMAGGVGSRFWPMSRTSRPKQFIDILGTGETLLQRTFKRFETVCPIENIYVVTSEIYRSLVNQQLPMLGLDQILCEPMRRNTAPCIAYACYKISDKNPDANIVVAPSDHIILNEDHFTEVIMTALQATAQSDHLLTLGMHPTRPHTGYGYIQFDDTQPSPYNNSIFKVKTFTEKPQLELAVSFLESGDFLWNAGIFIWNLRAIMRAFEKHLPEVNDVFREGRGLYNTQAEAEFISKAYAVVKSISIDYGILEKANNVFVLAAEFGWSDLGSWTSLYEVRPKDAGGNAVMGQNVMTYDSKNCIVNIPDKKLVVIQGLNDFIVVEDENCLLICHKQDEQEIRRFVDDIKEKKGEVFV